MWTAPFALRGLLQLRVQADQVVRSGTGVTQDDLSTLLANLTVVLVVCLIAIPILLWRREKEEANMGNFQIQKGSCLVTNSTVFQLHIAMIV